MIKWITALIFGLITAVVLLAIFLSFYGLESKYFNSFVKEKTKTFDQNLDLNFNKTKILLNLKNFELKIKLLEPEIIYNNNQATLTRFVGNISIQSFFKKEFALSNIDVGLGKTDIKKVISIVKQRKPSTFLIILRQLVNQGEIKGEAKLYFDNNGKIKDNYIINGSLFNLDAKFLDKFYLVKTSADFQITKNKYFFNIEKGQLIDVNLQNSNIQITKNKNEFFVNTNLNTQARINNVNDFLNTFSLLINKELININSISFDLINNISFIVKKGFKIENFVINGKGTIDNINLNHNFKKYTNRFNDNIQKEISFNSNKVSYSLKSKIIKFESNGLIKLTKESEKFITKINYNSETRQLNFNSEMDINFLDIKIASLNYKKEVNDPAKIILVGKLNENKKNKLNLLEFYESKNKILFKNVIFDEKNKIENFDEFIIITRKNNSVNNNFKIKKVSNKFIISGNKYDASYLLNTLHKGDDKNLLSKKFNGNFKINIDEIIADKNDKLYDFSAISNYKKGKQFKLSAKANFSDTEFVDISITPKESGKKNLVVFSDRAAPFIQNLKFIKGFEGGKLEYVSNYDKRKSISKLKITDFKLQDVPVLAKLLTLASLQGIADLLTGEGIRFKELDMDFNSNKNLITIDEMYAIGPSISILMSGYIEKDKLVSLRGTLVPASTLQKNLGFIPIIGDILVGKKPGEGIFGVSFKIKGHPKKMKTTVNPIKTLTPRFITRTLEKIKKTNNQNSN